MKNNEMTMPTVQAAGTDASSDTRAPGTLDTLSPGGAVASEAAILHPGSCHCGAVRFQVELDASFTGSRCNCTICTKVSSTGTIVKPERFRLLAGEESVSVYEWGAKIARRYFCNRCGVWCFSRGYLEEVGGAFVSINVNALDDVETGEVPAIYWDGRHNNWHAGPRDRPWPIFSANDNPRAQTSA